MSNDTQLSSLYRLSFRRGAKRLPLIACMIALTTGNLYAGSTSPLPPAISALLNNQPACPETGLSIRLTVKNVKSSRGIITADLHGDNPDDFLKEIVGRGRAAATKGETHVCIPVKKPGIYAIAIYHDVNSNLKLDKNFLGIPSEAIGISNNPKFLLAPPKFNESAFTVTDQGADLVIVLRNAL